MTYGAIKRRLPLVIRRHILSFETAIEEAVSEFARSLPPSARVMDAGAGEGTYANHFEAQSYCAVDLAVGDGEWNYGQLDVIADLVCLPFRDGTFQACINIVTLEHVREPSAALGEIARTLAAGSRLLLVVPQEWEVHQAPHDYFRFTIHGVRHLLESAGLEEIEIRPVGGFFRLLSRRLLNALQFFPGIWFWPAALLLTPPALILPWFDSLDRQRNFTLGYICTAKRPSY